MFTVCPKCALTLVVTAADLRIAQGYVRCGRCSSVFNSLPHLTDERPPPLPPEAFAPPPPAPAEPHGADEDGGTAEVLALASGPDEPAAEDESAAELSAGGAAEEPSQDLPHDAQADPADDEEEETAEAARHKEDAPAGGDSSQAAPAATALAGDSLATTVLPQDIDPDADSSSQPAIPEEALEFDPEKADAAALFIAAPPDPQWAAATGTFKALSAIKPEAVEPREVDAAYLASMLRAVGPEVPAVPAAVPAPRAPLVPSVAPVQATPAVEDVPAASEDPLGAHARVRPSFLSRVPPSVWRIGTPLALLLLFAQIVNHNRDALAATARFNQPLTALYGALGVRLVPSWDLRAYDVRQLGAEASPPGAGLITVRASIKNGAPQAQPLPLLRVTLQDRFGNRIAARDVAPSAYLPGAATRMASLSAGQRIDAAIGFVDPGANAVGFEIDACLPASAGGIACANDAGAR